MFRLFCTLKASEVQKTVEMSKSTHLHYSSNVLLASYLCSVQVLFLVTLFELSCRYMHEDSYEQEK